MACELRHQTAVLVGVLSANVLLCTAPANAQGQPRPISDVSFSGSSTAYGPGFSSPGRNTLRGTTARPPQQPPGDEPMELVFVTDDVTDIPSRAVPQHTAPGRASADAPGSFPFGKTLSKAGLPTLRFLNGREDPNHDLEMTSISVVSNDRMTNQQVRSTPMRDENVVPARHEVTRSPQLQARTRTSRSQRPSLLGYLHNGNKSFPAATSVPRNQSASQAHVAPSTDGGTVLGRERQPPGRSQSGSPRTNRKNPQNSTSRAGGGVMSAAKRRSTANDESRSGAARPVRRRPLPLRSTSESGTALQTPTISQPQQIAVQPRRPSPTVRRAGGVSHASMQQQKVVRANSGPKLSPPQPPRPRLAKSHAPQLQRTPSEPELLTPAQHHVRDLIVQIHEIAHAAESEEEFTHVVETCRRALAIEPKGETAAYAKQLCAWGLNRRGQIKADRCDDKEAILDFEDAIRLDPKLWRAIHNRGVLRAQAGEFEIAFDDFNRCTELNPRFAKAYSNRAALFVQARDLLSALQDYRRAIQLDPDLAVAHKGRGRVCHMLGSLEEALYHFDAAVQLAPEDAHVLASRADLLVDLGRYADASTEYRQAIQLDGSLAHAYRSSAWLLATCPDESVRDAEQALLDAKRAIELDTSDNPVSFDTLAAAEANAGDFEAAVETIARAIAIAPDQERSVYLNRLDMYRKSEPYRIEPVTPVSQVSFSE